MYSISFKMTVSLKMNYITQYFNSLSFSTYNMVLIRSHNENNVISKFNLN